MGAMQLNRRDAVKSLLQERGGLLVISGLGSPSYDLMAAGDHARNYYLWGAMGGAAMMGLGLAQAQPQTPVLVLTGDGEMLMGLGSLATIALRATPNLTIAVLDNGHYGETGMQQSHSGLGVQLERVASSVDFAWSARINSINGIDDLRCRMHSKSGPNFAAITIANQEEQRVLPSRDGVLIKNRMQAALELP